MWMRQLVLVWVILASACVTPRSRADAAYARADYVAAADQYDLLSQQAPQDGELRARRDDARAHALILRTIKVQQLRRAGQVGPALTELAALLARAHQWPDAHNPESTRAIADEVASASRFVGEQIRALVAADQPLAAEDLVASRTSELPFAELAPLWRTLGDAIRERGQARCHTAAPADPAAEPYLARLAQAYCAHFGVEIAVAPLPDRFGDVATDGEISGMTATQRAQLDAALAGVLRRTPWFDPAAGPLRVMLAGTQAVAFGSAEVERHARWSQPVQYMATETYQEPYQQSYQESYQESYTVEVPYTSYSTESYSCGYGTHSQTCSRQVSHSESRSETRYRTSYRTAYRTAYRSATRLVSKLRMEPRVFTYAAIERNGNYSGAWRLATDLGAAVPPLDVRVDDRTRKTGDDHDASFPAAGVAPSRAALPSFDDWVARLTTSAEHTFADRLRGHWTTAFCQRPSYDAEAAIRCAFGAPLPPAARAALARTFVGDTDRVLARFAAATAPSP